MTKLYEGDLETLRDEEWEIGGYWSEPGVNGYYIRHDDEHPAWLKVRVSPCSEDSLQDEEGFVGPHGAADSATEALLDLIGD